MGSLVNSSKKGIGVSGWRPSSSRLSAPEHRTSNNFSTTTSVVAWRLVVTWPDTTLVHSLTRWLHSLPAEVHSEWYLFETLATSPLILTDLAFRLSLPCLILSLSSISLRSTGRSLSLPLPSLYYLPTHEALDALVPFSYCLGSVLHSL